MAQVPQVPQVPLTDDERKNFLNKAYLVRPCVDFHISGKCTAGGNCTQTHEMTNTWEPSEDWFFNEEEDVIRPEVYLPQIVHLCALPN